MLVIDAHCNLLDIVGNFNIHDVPRKIIIYIFKNVEFLGGVVQKIPKGAEDLYVAMMRKGATSVDGRQVFNLRILFQKSLLAQS